MRQFLDRDFRINGGLLCAKVVNIRPGSLLWLARAHRFTGNNPCNLSIGVVHIARNNGPLRTNNHAGWLQANLSAVRTIVALRSGIAIRINVKRIIGTRLHARLATDAAIGVEVHNAILALIEGFGRTNSHARCIVTMIAAVDQKIAPRVGELTLFDILYPRAINTDRNIMFGLARHGAGMTADTLALVYNKRVFRHHSSP